MKPEEWLQLKDEAYQMNRDGDRILEMARGRLKGQHPYYAVLRQELLAAWRAVVLQP